MEKRNYGIDLLRIVSMFMVCILHVLGRGGILNAASKGSTHYAAFWALETVCYCAVDCFAIISGYMSQNSKTKYVKLIDMWLQTFFYSFILTLVLMLTHVGSFDIIELIKQAMPVRFSSYWYITGYFILYLAMPILNQYLFNSNITSAKKVLLVIFVLFSVFSVINDPFTNAGYSAMWLIICYCIGVLSKRIGLLSKVKTSVLLFLFAFNTLLSWAVVYFFDIHRLVSYTSPTILLNGLVLVVLFSRIRCSHQAQVLIKWLSSTALGVYLFQLNLVIWNEVINDRFTSIAEKNLFTGVLLIIFWSAVLFITGSLIEKLRSTLAKAIKAPEISRRTVAYVEKLLTSTADHM